MDYQAVNYQQMNYQPVTVNCQPPVNINYNTVNTTSIKRKLQDDTKDEHISKKRIQHEASPPSLDKDDKMMIEDELTDEDEFLTTPSAMDYYNTYYIPTNVDEDLDKGGFTGQLELGWTDMYYDMY